MSFASKSVRLLKKTAFAALAVCSFLGLSAEVVDRLHGSSLDGAAAVLQRDIFGEELPIETETRTLARLSAESLGMPALAKLRVSVSDELHLIGIAARFNPTTWRVSISDAVAALPPAERREILLHEIGHAAAMASGVSPNWPLHAPGAATLDGSLLAFQLFHESFADAFALGMALRLFPSDPKSALALRRAERGAPPFQSSAAHDTYLALREFAARSGSFSALGPEPALAVLAEASTAGSAATLARLKIEREAACSTGLRAVAKIVRDMGYQLATLPWESLRTGPFRHDGDPRVESAVSSLVALRSFSAPPSPWQEAIAQASPQVKAALLGASVDSAAPDDLARQWTASFAFAKVEHGSADPESLFYSKIAAKEAISTLSHARDGFRETFAWALTRLADAVDPLEAKSCSPTPPAEPADSE